MSVAPDPLAWTLDEPAAGVVIAQPARGFRFGAEAMWLAGAAMERAPRSALDLGTGSGVVAQLLAARGVAAVGVDRWAGWADGWARSTGGARLRVADVLDLAAVGLGAADVVVSNPPFFRAFGGPAAPDAWRAVARTESTATVGDFVRVAADFVSGDGQLIFVVPVDRQADLAASLPDALGARRWTQIGRRRLMLRASRGPRADHHDAIDDDGAEVRAWYHAVGARFRDEGRR